MATLMMIVATSLLLASTIQASIVAPAISYTRAIPYNVLPFANSVSVYTRTLLPAYTRFASEVVRSPFAASFLPGLAPAIAPAVAPVAKVSSFLPAPFAAPAGIAGTPVAGPAVAPGFAPSFPAGPVIAPSPFLKTINPYYPTPLAHGLVPASINPAYGRSVHALAPAALHGTPAVPAIASAPYFG